MVTKRRRVVIQAGNKDNYYEVAFLQNLLMSKIFYFPTADV